MKLTHPRLISKKTRTQEKQAEEGNVAGCKRSAITSPYTHTHTSERAACTTKLYLRRYTIGGREQRSAARETMAMRKVAVWPPAIHSSSSYKRRERLTRNTMGIYSERQMALSRARGVEYSLSLFPCVSLIRIYTYIYVCAVCVVHITHSPRATCRFTLSFALSLSLSASERSAF